MVELFHPCFLLLNQPIFVVRSEGQLYGGKKLHQLAMVEPAKADDLRIKDVVVGRLCIHVHVCASMLC